MMSKAALTLASAVGNLPRLEQALSDLPGFQPAEHTTLTSTYYDTAAGRLKRDGLALRVRDQNGHYSQMVICADIKGEPLLAHQEWGDPTDGEPPGLRALNGSTHLPEVLSDPELRARFTTVIKRTLFLLEPDASTQIAGTLDAGEIRTAEGEDTEPICEVGLQLKRGDPAALYGTGLRLLEKAPLRIEAHSKVERGYRLLEKTTAKPQTQYSIRFCFQTTATVEESLQKIGLGCLTLFLRNEGTALADLPDGVHQMRVAIRRLRSVVTTMRRILPCQLTG
jgi:triphosphatase